MPMRVAPATGQGCDSCGGLVTALAAGHRSLLVCGSSTKPSVCGSPSGWRWAFGSGQPAASSF